MADCLGRGTMWE